MIRNPIVLLILLSTHYIAFAAEPDWVAPMREVHAKFKGTPGTVSLFGDSISNSLAFWGNLQWDPMGLDDATTKALAVVKGRMPAECWSKWRGPAFGNESGKTTRWATENVDAWIKKLNPESAVILFGTNDLIGIEAKEYETRMRTLITTCLRNGTVPIVTTIPPRSGSLAKSKQFAEVVRKLAAEFKVPLIDYQAEILKRRPDDWDGKLPKFREFAKDEYQVPTLVAADGAHPSNPGKFNQYNAEGLNNNGYMLRNYLTLHTVADVFTKVYGK